MPTNRQAFNANANNHQTFNANANNRPAYNNNANASFKAPANNEAHYAAAPPQR